MANNRMYLMHRPSGRAVSLGKRMGWGWYKVPDNIKESIEELFGLVESQEAGGCQDDFCIALETAGEGATLADDKWKHTDDDIPVRTLIRTEETEPE